jgi:hypothetical protein
MEKGEGNKLRNRIVIPAKMKSEDMIFYIGDISKADAKVLKELAGDYKSILEFGCGASTQVLAAYCKGRFRSIDTEPIWIERTKRNLGLLNITKEVEFFEYGKDPAGVYDFIFVDGLPELRLPFALERWDMLIDGGVMALHDTRRSSDFKNACELMTSKHAEILCADFNWNGSNITVIRKQTPLYYEDWNQKEGRLTWQFGHSDIDMKQFKTMYDEHNANK